MSGRLQSTAMPNWRFISEPGCTTIPPQSNWETEVSARARGLPWSQAAGSLIVPRRARLAPLLTALARVAAKALSLRASSRDSSSIRRNVVSASAPQVSPTVGLPSSTIPRGSVNACLLRSRSHYACVFDVSLLLRAHGVQRLLRDTLQSRRSDDEGFSKVCNAGWWAAGDGGDVGRRGEWGQGAG